MTQFIFTFTFNPDTKESTYVGNIEPPVALGVLQQIVIAYLVKKAQEQPEVIE